ncbi:MAG: DUF2157 domain-containing protein [Vicinamibacterales bacterium]
MTTIDRLEGWKAAGAISEEQHTLLTALVRRERFSVFVELSALVYVGVLSIVGGLAWTFRDYVTNLGDAAILGILTLLMVVSFGYCLTRTHPYANDEVESPTFVFDYVLYFGCLIFSATLAFIETRFGVFHGWDTHLLIAAVVFGVLAYRFDNRFVLSLALSTLAGYLGLRLSLFDTISNDHLRLLAIIYGAFLLGIGGLLYRQGIKRHFLDVFLQLGANAILLATAFGAIDGPHRNLYLAALLSLAATAIYLGVRFSRFAFVAYGTLYAYGVVSIRMLDALRSATVSLLYFVVTGTLVVVALVVLARRFGREE